jgi:hypothetical protein
MLPQSVVQEVTLGHAGKAREDVVPGREHQDCAAEHRFLRDEFVVMVV